MSETISLLSFPPLAGSARACHPEPRKELTMTKNLGILALLEARPGKERELHDLLKGARALAAREPGTVTWYAVQARPRSFAIFDTFEDEAGRTAHLQGQIAAA